MVFRLILDIPFKAMFTMKELVLSTEPCILCMKEISDM